MPQETLKRLRGMAYTAENVDWPAHLARRHGWQAANRQYQARQRDLGRTEMEALLEALDLQPPLPPDTLRDVLGAAVSIYLQTDATTAEASFVEGSIRIRAVRCPLYDRLSDPSWHGLTACGCFARIRGWHDALDLEVDEDVLLNRKWGDAICEVVLHEPLPIVR